MKSVDEVELVPGRGIVGDRYYTGLGEFSPDVPDPDHELTLIEVEQVERFNAETRLSLGAGEFRRNVVTRGVSLNGLVGVEFSLGEVTVRGIELCEPCRHLADIVHREVLPRLVHRAGLRACIVRGGLLRAGDAIDTTGAA